MLPAIHGISQQLIPVKPSYKIIDPAEPQPQFPGGYKAYIKFIEKNLRWPAGEICAEGRVIISFTVDEKGKIINPVVLKGLQELYDMEALKVVKKMPKWIPAKVNGKPIKSRYTVPVTFRMVEE